MVSVVSRHSPRGERAGGCGEANNGSATVGDWAVALNERANSKTGPHNRTTVPNLKQFRMPMRILSGWHDTERGPVQSRLNHKKNKAGMAYRKLRKTYLPRPHPNWFLMASSRRSRSMTKNEHSRSAPPPGDLGGAH